MKSALELLREFRAQLPEQGDSDLPEPHDPLETGPALEVREEISAVRFWSKLLQREVWLALDEQTAEELIVEFPNVPVLTPSDISKLEGKPPELLKALLDVMGHLPARVM